MYHEKLKERKRIVERARCELLTREIANIEAEMKGNMIEEKNKSSPTYYKK